MEAKKKRLTLVLDSQVEHRLKATAARKGVSMGQYCRAAIDKELDKDDAEGQPPPRMSIDELIARQKRIYGDRVLPGSSVDLIHEAREERDRQLDGR